MIQYYRDPEAERLSIALWDLARPVRTAGETARMFHVVDAEGVSYLEVDTEFAFVVHPAAVLGELAEILESRLSAEAIEDLEALVLSLRGERVVACTAFAGVFNGQALPEPEGGM